MVLGPTMPTGRTPGGSWNQRFRLKLVTRDQKSAYPRAFASPYDQASSHSTSEVRRRVPPRLGSSGGVQAIAVSLALSAAVDPVGTVLVAEDTTSVVEPQPTTNDPNVNEITVTNRGIPRLLFLISPNPLRDATILTLGLSLLRCTLVCTDPSRQLHCRSPRPLSGHHLLPGKGLPDPPRRPRGQLIQGLRG